MPIRHFVVKFAGAGFLLSSAAVWAAAAADTSQGALDEIVVTASKRDEKLHDVAMSVTALGSDQLALRQETGFLDWAAQVPGLSLQTSNPAYSRLIIRGENVGSVGAQDDRSARYAPASTIDGLGMAARLAKRCCRASGPRPLPISTGVGLFAKSSHYLTICVR